MRNKLTDLQNHLFELMEKLNDDDLIGDELDEEVKRSGAFSSLAIIAVKNAALMARCAELQGLPTGDLPLLPSTAVIPFKSKQPEPAKKKMLLDNVKKQAYG